MKAQLRTKDGVKNLIQIETNRSYEFITWAGGAAATQTLDLERLVPGSRIAWAFRLSFGQPPPGVPQEGTFEVFGSPEGTTWYLLHTEDWDLDNLYSQDSLAVAFPFIRLKFTYTSGAAAGQLAWGVVEC